MSNTAFESITSRQAYYAGEALEKYAAVEYKTGGKLFKAVGAGLFAGIVLYPAATSADMVTVVKGIFPAIGSEDIPEGQTVTIDAENPGMFKAATTGDDIYGIALTGALAGELFSVAMSEVVASAVDGMYKTVTVTKTGTGTVEINDVTYTAAVKAVEDATMVIGLGATPTVFTVDGVNKVASLVANKYTFVMPATNVAVAVTFA